MYHWGTFMDHANGTISLYNMVALYKKKSVLSNTRIMLSNMSSALFNMKSALCKMRTGACNMRVQYVIRVHYENMPM